MGEDIIEEDLKEDTVWDWERNQIKRKEVIRRQ
jgi:hypothetical protein